jgi:preprotein translocase subunit SecE
LRRQRRDRTREEVMATNTNVETVSTTVDRTKIALAIIAVIAGLAGFYLLSQQPLVLRIASVLIGLAVGAGIAATSEPGKRFFAFGRESVAETKKVVWPTRKETIQTTAVVFGFVTIMALTIWAVDKIIEFGIYDLLLGWRK